MTWERVNRFLIEKVMVMMVMMVMVMMMMRRRRRPRKREDATRVGANEPRRRVNGVGQRHDENLRSSGRPPNDRPVAVVFRDAKHSAAERSCQSVDPSRCLSLRLRRPTRRRRRPFCFRFCFFLLLLPCLDVTFFDPDFDFPCFLFALLRTFISIPFLQVHVIFRGLLF